MDPQWNLFQSSASSPSLLEYGKSYGNVMRPSSYSHAQASTNIYNGFYNPSPSSAFSNQSKPLPNILSNSYSGSSYPTALPPAQPSSYSTPPVRTPDIFSQSSYFSTSNTPSSNSVNAPTSDFKIGTFSMNSNGFVNETNSVNSCGITNQQNHNNGSVSTSQDTKETGIIEKLLQTYGFIQCCERQARLFFHFSQFDGNTEHLRIGDPVEFEVTFDRRTGKPIASSVSKISPDVVLSEKRVVGVVTTELKSEHSNEHQGRISYENRGECFFLPYGKEDVEGYVTLKPGDKVSFQIATSQRSGNLGAKHVRLENPVQPVKYQGVVSAIKDSYGFIERADVVDEIFFHFSESKDIPGGLKLGDDVEFLIQTHNGKEVATEMIKLPSGTVVFEDVNLEEIRGQVLKPVEKIPPQNQKDPLTGRIRYRGKDRSEVEVKFGERDQAGDFTLKHGDWVKFNVATDRRDNLQKATHISLLDESFNVSGEKREQGLISSLKEGFGFIKCADRDAQMFFKYNELLDPQREICVGEEVEFTTVTDQSGQSPNRFCGIRIRRMPKGSVKFEVLVQENVPGEVCFESTFPMQSPLEELSESSMQPGLISYLTDSVKQTLNFYPDKEKPKLQLGDRVTFSIYMIKRNKQLIARDVKLLPAITSIHPCSTNRQSQVGSGRTSDHGTTNFSTLPTNYPADCDFAPASSIYPNTFTAPAKTTYNNIPCSIAPNLINNLPQTTNYGKEPLENDASGNDGVNMRTNKTVGPITTVAPTPVGIGTAVVPDGEAEVLTNQETSTVDRTEKSSVKPDSSSRNVSSRLLSSFSGSSGPSFNTPKQAPIHQGYIATLKESFGFIETINHDKEIFFHFSNFEGNVNDLDLGDEVEYTISSRTTPGDRLSAENVKSLPLGSLLTPKVLGQVYEGTVLRPMRSVNPDQAEYSGLVCVGKEEEKLGKHQFGVVGLVNKKELLQKCDQVTFQLDVDGWAVNIQSIRKKLLATVVTVKGQYGFLNCGSDDGKRLFFHQSEVKDNVTLSPGDEVEFVVITNLKTGKSSACNVTRIFSTSGRNQRPDRLVSKLKGLSVDSSKPRIRVVRQPRGPDGTEGFTHPREDLRRP